jgi:hypothetical protein
MFERFMERARKVVVLAQEEARSFGYAYIGTEHFLLGLVREKRRGEPDALQPGCRGRPGARVGDLAVSDEPSRSGSRAAPGP